MPSANKKRMMSWPANYMQTWSPCATQLRVWEDVVLCPIPILPQNERFSRLLSLHHWLENFCSAAGYDFISNFDYFWTNSRLYRADGVHSNRKGTKQLTANFIQFIVFNSF